jgi:prolyl 4-hydroxylase
VIPPCPPPGVVPSIQPGKLNEFFERIVDNAPGNSADVTKGMTNYTVYVHSRPGINNAGGIVARDMQQLPWIISLDNFLTEEECKTLIQLAQKAGSRHGTTEVQLDRSLASLEMNQEQILSSVWCSYQNNCRGEDIPQLVHDRIAKITGVPVGNSEDFQMTQHEQGQFDNLHHDFVEMHRDLRCGPRLLTFQLYLSDDVEGGETTFPHWQIAVKPKAGRALLWPNVLSSDLKQSDVRMAHASKSVTKGKNFVATAHLHMYEFVDLPCGV